jgi:hypothetical protein
MLTGLGHRRIDDGSTTKILNEYRSGVAAQERQSKGQQV